MVNNALTNCIFIRGILVWSILNSLPKVVFCSDEHEAFKEAPDTIKGDELWSGIEMPQSSYFEGTTNLSVHKRCSRSLFCCLSNLVPYWVIWQIFSSLAYVAIFCLHTSTSNMTLSAPLSKSVFLSVKHLMIKDYPLKTICRFWFQTANRPSLMGESEKQRHDRRSRSSQKMYENDLFLWMNHLMSWFLGLQWTFAGGVFLTYNEFFLSINFSEGDIKKNRSTAIQWC